MAPRQLLFLLKGPKGPFVHPFGYYFYSRARTALPCTLSVTIFTQGPEGPFRAPRRLLFLLKGPNGPSMHLVTYYFYSRAQRALPCPSKSRPIGRPFSSTLNCFNKLRVILDLHSIFCLQFFNKPICCIYYHFTVLY